MKRPADMNTTLLLCILVIVLGLATMLLADSALAKPISVVVRPGRVLVMERAEAERQYLLHEQETIDDELFTALFTAVGRPVRSTDGSVRFTTLPDPLRQHLELTRLRDLRDAANNQ